MTIKVASSYHFIQELSTMDRDLLGSAPLPETARVCMAVISALQSEQHKGAVVNGLCSAFVLVSELIGVSIPELVVMTKNHMTDGQFRYPQFEASKEYLAKEIFNHN